MRTVIVIHIPDPVLGLENSVGDSENLGTAVLSGDLASVKGNNDKVILTLSRK